MNLPQQAIPFTGLYSQTCLDGAGREERKMFVFLDAGIEGVGGWFEACCVNIDCSV